jgi:hypothetical protein
VELDRKYVIVRRWQQYTGTQAVLDGDGHTFESVAEERGAVAALSPDRENRRFRDEPQYTHAE